MQLTQTLPKARSPKRQTATAQPSKALSYLTDNRLLGVVDIVSVGIGVGQSVTMPLDIEVGKNLSKFAAGGHGLLALANGIQSVQRKSVAHGATALGHICSAAGHTALVAGSGPLGLGLVVGGALLTNLAGQRKAV